MSDFDRPLILRFNLFIYSFCFNYIRASSSRFTLVVVGLAGRRNHKFRAKMRDGAPQPSFAASKPHARAAFIINLTFFLSLECLNTGKGVTRAVTKKRKFYEKLRN